MLKISENLKNFLADNSYQIDRPFDVASPDENGRKKQYSAMEWAILRNEPEIIKELYQLQVKLQVKFPARFRGTHAEKRLILRTSWLHYAVANGRLESAKALLNAGHPCQNPFLAHVIKENSKGLSKGLFQLSKKPFQVIMMFKESIVSAYRAAVRFGLCEAVSIFAKYDEKNLLLESRDTLNYTAERLKILSPLSEAFYFRRTGVATLLLDQGATLYPEKGHSPTDIVKAQPHHPCAPLLLQYSGIKGKEERKAVFQQLPSLFSMPRVDSDDSLNPDTPRARYEPTYMPESPRGYPGYRSSCNSG